MRVFQFQATMHQRERASYGRAFLFGKNHQPTRRIIPAPLEAIGSEPGIGLIPPEFDDLQGGETEITKTLRSEHSPR